MQWRQLGRSGLATPPLAFGGNVFGWTADEPTSLSLLDAFADAGFTLIDTANSYSRWVPGHEGGESETILGKWLARRQDRERLLIATKVGSDMGPAGKGLSRQHIERSIEDSLRRLNTDYVDLYQAHFDDEATPIEETLETFARLVAQGKVRAIGASNFSAARISASLAISASRGLPRYETLQPLYNLYDREPFESELAPLCERESLGVINYYSLASGFLTGKYRSQDDVARGARARSNAKYLTPRGIRILDALESVARARGAAPASVALGWLIAQPAVTAPIASATTLSQLQALIAGARMELTRDELRSLDTASAGE
ncbi:MAG: aldo/keto reductase [Pseudomonadota bacterium]|nr:aldo/keto reductase [Pseudomonadota bacterium]